MSACLHHYAGFAATCIAPSHVTESIAADNIVQVKCQQVRTRLAAAMPSFQCKVPAVAAHSPCSGT